MSADETSNPSRPPRASQLPPQNPRLASADAVRAANQELRERSEQMLEQPLVVLIEQRDQALSQLEEVKAQTFIEKSALVSEQDAFIAFLLSEHDDRVSQLHDELFATRDRLKRVQARAVARESFEDRDEQVLVLQERLEDAYRQVDDARAESAALQSQLDEAIRASDEARDAALDEINEVRDEIIDLQGLLDEAHRRLEDARDAARDQALGLNEQLDITSRELDDRREEVRRLRTRLAEVDMSSGRQSVPPPAGDELSRELEDARTEAKRLRYELIIAKRALSSARAEVEAAQVILRRRELSRGSAQWSPSPAAERRMSPAPERRMSPAPERRMSPAPERRMSPAPERGVIPALERTMSPAPRSEPGPSSRQPPVIKPRPSQRPGGLYSVTDAGVDKITTRDPDER